MKHFRKLLASIKRSDELFNLIEEGDRIVVGISGGKDSIVLFDALMTYTRYAGKNFTIIPVILDLGFPAFDAEIYINYFNSVGNPLYINDNKDVVKILEIQKELQNLPKLPCSICSKMKKAGINAVAKKLNANKVAFAHHLDDALETLFMNMIGGGRIATFEPKMHLDRADITFIRPLILADEDLITSVLKEHNLPLLEYACPNNKKTRREDIKNLLLSIYGTYEEAKNNFALMLTNDQMFNLWFDNYETSLAPRVVVRKVTTPALQSKALYIRTKVFIEEQRISVEDEYDVDEALFTSFVLFKDEEAIGTIRYSYTSKTRTALLGRLAIIKEERSKGYGRLLLRYLENILKRKYGNLVLEIHGQAHLKTYYEKEGYIVIGDLYSDAGIPHYKFIKEVI